MALYNNVYIGHVETVNIDSYEKDSVVETKVVVLKLSGYDEKNKTSNYKPLRKYGEYYKITNVEPLKGLVNDRIINQAIQKTGKPEVQQLKNM